MLKSLRSKIFITFALISFTELIAISYFFGRVIVRETETYVWDTLARRVQMNGSAFEAELKASALTPADLAAKMKLTLFMPDGSQRGQPLSQFDSHFVKDLLPTDTSTTQSVVTSCKDRSGEAYVCAMAYSPRTKAWIFEATPTATALQALRKVSPEIFGFGILILVLSILASYAITKIIFRPLQQFSDAARVISEGRYRDLPLPLQRQDEIGALATAFQKMASDLESREKSLESTGMKLAHSARLASIGQMGASIAHEVKNPLTSMMGYAKILDQKIPEGELKEAAQIIAQEADRCNQILGQMLKFARNDPTERKPYALKDVIESTVALAKAEAKKAKVEIKVDLRDEPVLVGSAQQIQQVLFNLLINAIHASRDALNSKQGAKQIWIRCHEAGGLVHIDVEDHALGIPKPIQQRIFDPFFTTKDKREGTGLGLSVALDIIQDQGGRLSFDSEEGVGTTFHVALPLA